MTEEHRYSKTKPTTAARLRLANRRETEEHETEGFDGGGQGDKKPSH